MSILYTNSTHNIDYGPRESSVWEMVELKKSRKKKERKKIRKMFVRRNTQNIFG